MTGSTRLKPKFLLLSAPASWLLRLGRGEEGSVKAAAGAAERSERSGEPLQVPTACAKRPPEAEARDKGKKFRSDVNSDEANHRSCNMSQ